MFTNGCGGGEAAVSFAYSPNNQNLAFPHKKSGNKRQKGRQGDYRLCESNRNGGGGWVVKF